MGIRTGFSCQGILDSSKRGIQDCKKKIAYYSLDVIISVGYRVKLPRGIQFHIWANRVLKEYLIKGYALNEQKLKEQADQLHSLKQTVNFLGSVLKSKELSSDKASGLLKVITDYGNELSKD